MPAATARDNEDREPEQLWQSRQLRRAAFSGVLLTASLVAAWAYPLRPVVPGTEGPCAGGWGSDIRALQPKRLAEGHAGVGTLMTNAALGVALGELGAAAGVSVLRSAKAWRNTRRRALAPWPARPAVAGADQAIPGVAPKPSWPATELHVGTR